MIRLATQCDMGGIVALLAALHARTSVANVEPNWSLVVKRMEQGIVGRDILILVAENNHVLTGLLVGVLTSIWWEPGTRIASDLLFFSKHRGDGDKMVEWLEQWAFGSAAVHSLQMGISTRLPVDKARPFYERHGMTLEGTKFVKLNPAFLTAGLRGVA
jgi:hypothetical protein